MKMNLEKTAVDELRGQLRGEVLTPPERGYEEARALYNAMIEGAPR